MPMPLAAQSLITSRGHAIEARVYAENPAKGPLRAAIKKVGYLCSIQG